MPCAEKGFAQPELVWSWLPGPACADFHCVSRQCRGVLFFVSARPPPEQFFPESFICAPLWGCGLVAWGRIPRALSPLAPELFESDFQSNCSLAAHWGILLRLLCPVLFGQPRKVPQEAYQMVWWEWQVFNIIFTIGFLCKKKCKTNILFTKEVWFY